MAWNPETYPQTIRTEIHDYDRLQDEVVAATAGSSVRSILDLGVGTGETASRVLGVHPNASLVGIDSSPDMLRGAASLLPRDRVKLVEQGLEDPLPQGPFDLVVSALAIHHLDAAGKRDLFGRVADRLVPEGRLVFGDVVVPDDPNDALIENEPGYDMPNTIDEQLRWLAEAGFAPETRWVCKDLAVLAARLTDV